MAFGLTATTIAAITTTAVSTGVGVLSAVKAKKAQKLDNQIRLQQLQRQRVKQLREARIRRAEIANVAAQTGTAGASGAISAQGQAVTEAARNVSFLDVTGGLSRQRAGAQRQSAFFASISQLSQNVGSFANQNSARIFGQ